MGSFLLFLSIAYTAYLSAVMVYRIRSAVSAEMNRRVFLRELVLCAVFIAFAAAVRFGFFSPTRPLLIRLAGWGAAAGTAVTLLMAAVIAAGGWRRDAGEAGTVIVPGLALEHGRPTRGLRNRLRAAADYARSHPDCTILVSGGNETASSPAEAAVMREWLLAEGIGAHRIVTEARAANTLENFLFSAALTDPAEPVMIVTSRSHMRRSVRQARRAGFSRVLRLPAAEDPLAFGADLMWEIIAEIYYIVNGEKDPSLRSG